MTAILCIEHPITDFDTWKGAFDRFEQKRLELGVRDQRVLRPADNPKFVVIELEFNTRGEAERFQSFLQRDVWSSPERSPALAGTPQCRILTPAASG